VNSITLWSGLPRMASTSGKLHLLALLIRTTDNISTSGAFSGLTVQRKIHSEVHFLALTKESHTNRIQGTFSGFT
jgi:hypothetical protein